MDFRIGAQINKQNVAVRIRVNGIEVYRDARGDWLSAGEFFNDWLKPGENTIGWEAEKIDEAAEAQLELKIMRQDFETQSLDPIAEVGAEALPAKGEAKVEIPAGFPAKAFWGAEPAALEDAREPVLAELGKLFDAIEGGDANAVISIFADAMGVDTENEAMKAELEGLREALGALQAPSRPDSGDLTLVALAEGRLISVDRKDGEPVLSYRDPEGSVALSMPTLRFTRLQGSWTLT